MNAKSSMLVSGKLKIWSIILIIALLIVNLTASAFIFIDLKVMDAPDTTIKIDIVELNPEEAVIYHSIEIFNPNKFDMIIEDFQVITTTKEGDEVARINIEGGTITSNEKRTFSGSDEIAFSGDGYSVLTSKISGIIGVEILGFFKKTLPLSVNIETSAEDIIDNIHSPIIHIWGDFKEITTKRVDFAATVEVYNPNTFEIYIEDLRALIETETGKNVGNLEVEGGTIPAKDSVSLDGSGYVLVEALNAESLNVNMSSVAGVKIAGVRKSVSYTVRSHINIPKIEDIINLDVPTDATLRSNLRATPRGFVSKITLELSNPNKIGILAKDIVFSIYRVDNNEEELIASCSIPEGIAQPEDKLSVETEIPLPSRKLVFSLGKGFLPDSLLITVRANVTIPGLDQHVWIGLKGYQDMHPFL